MFEFAIGAMHRVGIDRYLTYYFAHRWQLVANLELATFERASNLIDELTKGRSIRSCIEVEKDGWVVVHVLVH